MIGSKELIASLPLHLGIGPGDLVVHPELAYPTYEVGTRLAGARSLATDSLTAVGPERPRLLWVNSPSNPSGRVLPVAHLRKMVAWARERGTVLVSDECYLECAWEAEPVSLLHPDVCDGDPTGLLAVHSLSKRSNLAGYRCAFVAGDPALVGELLAVRKNLGLQMPGPQQRAMIAALDDDEHVVRQHATGTPRGGRRCARRWSRPASGSTTRRRRSTCGRPGDEAVLGHRRPPRRAGHPGGSRGLLRPGRSAARAGRVHCDGRADLRRARPPERLTDAAAPGVDSGV